LKYNVPWCEIGGFMTRLVTKNIQIAILAMFALGLASSRAVAGINQWTSNGPYGGPVSMVAIDPTAPDTLYAATGGTGMYHAYGAGVFKSTDGGVSWVSMGREIGVATVRVLLIDPRTPSTLYSAAQDPQTSYAEICRSVDGASTWGQCSYISTLFLVMDPSNPSVFYARDEHLKKSTDGGASWNIIGNDFSVYGVSTLAITPKNPEVLYAGSYFEGIFKSIDGGNSWVHLTSDLDLECVVSLAVDPAMSTTVYAGTITRAGGGSGGIFKSLDGGMTWKELHGGLPDNAFSFLAVDPKNPSTVYGCGFDDRFGYSAGLFKSTDGGESWTELRNGLPTPQVCSVAIHPTDSSVLYASTMSGVYKSTDGGASWCDSNHGITNLPTFRVAIDPVDPAKRYAATMGGIFKSHDGGTTWELKSQGLHGLGATYLVIDPHDSKILYAAMLNQLMWDLYDGTPFLYKSLDEGETWFPLPRQGFDYFCLAMDPILPDHLLASGYGVVNESYDGGETWADLPVPIPWVHALAFDPAQPSVIYAAGSYGFSKSNDRGATWSPVSEDFSFWQFQFVVVDPDQPNSVFVGGYKLGGGTALGTVFFSSDGGDTFRVMGWGNGVFPSTVAIVPGPPKRYYVGIALAGCGVYASSDVDTPADLVNRGLMNPWVFHLVEDPATPGTVCASTGGFRPVSVIGVMENYLGSGVYSLTYMEVSPPVISSVVKAANPFRLTINGSNFHPSARILIDGTPAPVTVYKRESTLVAKGGAALKAMVPKGKTVQITVENEDDGGLSEPFPFRR
jgi:photosystem II stability/assembly factor-like uncharacterized protein